eukprot:CAMPEP_0203955826 /NCGR_PEP_ID=MMETSP0359-20131031/88329_1 /ASSEMBLY_ACC=CAM_ASM_000338 /TAXON_ID=268821 /ORGANISM="Scrippsiella Hangoei, Strain SHTV-5" /LENGTH=186 /DNA_ID=CAMNT_0050889493 /DNA_START=585 /DNA_END=1143 /DNA_ORIENTATION=+
MSLQQLCVDCPAPAQMPFSCKHCGCFSTQTLPEPPSKFSHCMCPLQMRPEWQCCDFAAQAPVLAKYSAEALKDMVMFSSPLVKFSTVRSSLNWTASAHWLLKAACFLRQTLPEPPNKFAHCKSPQQGLDSWHGSHYPMQACSAAKMLGGAVPMVSIWAKQAPIRMLDKTAEAWPSYIGSARSAETN